MQSIRYLIFLMSTLAPLCHAMNKDGSSAPIERINLHEAARLGRITTVRQLLDGGAQIDAEAPEYLNATPLGLAVYNGYTDVVEELIKRGANVNHQLREIRATPLHIAAMKGRAHIARLLLKAGAQVNAKSKDNMMPLHICAECGKFDLIQFIHIKPAEKKPSRNETVHNLSQNLYVATAELLLDHGALLDFSPIKGTPLHLAARHGNAELVSLFIKRGANVAARRPISATPLHEAVVGSAAEISRQPQKAAQALSVLRAFICTPSQSVMREARGAVVPLLCCLARLQKAEPMMRRENGDALLVPKDMRKLLVKYCLAATLVDKQLEHLKELFGLKMKFSASEFTPAQLTLAQVRTGAAPELLVLAEFLDPARVEQHRLTIYTHLMKLVA